MNEAINFSKEKLALLKQKLASARAKIKNIDVNLVKSRLIILLNLVQLLNA